MLRLQHCYYNTTLCYCKWYIYLLHCTVKSTFGFQVFNVYGILVTKSNFNSSHSLIKSYRQCPYIFACLLPTFARFNNVLVSLKWRCCHVVNICIGDDTTFFCCSDMEMFHTGFIHCLSVQSGPVN